MISRSNSGYDAIDVGDLNSINFKDTGNPYLRLHSNSFFRNSYIDDQDVVGQDYVQVKIFFDKDEFCLINPELQAIFMNEEGLCINCDNFGSVDTKSTDKETDDPYVNMEVNFNSLPNDCRFIILVFSLRFAGIYIEELSKCEAHILFHHRDKEKIHLVDIVGGNIKGSNTKSSASIFTILLKENSQWFFRESFRYYRNSFSEITAESKRIVRNLITDSEEEFKHFKSIVDIGMENGETSDLLNRKIAELIHASEAEDTDYSLYQANKLKKGESIWVNSVEERLSELDRKYSDLLVDIKDIDKKLRKIIARITKGPK